MSSKNIEIETRKEIRRNKTGGEVNVTDMRMLPWEREKKSS